MPMYIADCQLALLWYRELLGHVSYRYLLGAKDTRCRGAGPKIVAERVTTTSSIRASLCLLLKALNIHTVRG